MSSYMQIDGKQWQIWEACIFCGHTAAVQVSPHGYSLPTGLLDPCPANGNGEHIRPGAFPEPVMDAIKKSRGIK